MAYRDGAPCHRCRGRDTLPGLRLRCRGSLTEAAVYAAGLHRQQPHLFEHSDRFVVISAAHGKQLHELGLPAEKAATLPNFIPERQFAERSAAGEGRFALVAGRLVEEKGYDTAIQAARMAGVPLQVAGEGPDEPRLRALADEADVRFTGLLSPTELAELRRQAAVVMAPSRCEEACPYAVLDAAAAGVPVLGSDRGGIPELIGRAAALDPEAPEAWAEALRALWSDPKRRSDLGDELLQSSRERLGEDSYYEQLMAVYGARLGAGRRRRRVARAGVRRRSRSGVGRAASGGISARRGRGHDLADGLRRAVAGARRPRRGAAAGSRRGGCGAGAAAVSATELSVALLLLLLLDGAGELRTVLSVWVCGPAGGRLCRRVRLLLLG